MLEAETVAVRVPEAAASREAASASWRASIGVQRVVKGNKNYL